MKRASRTLMALLILPLMAGLFQFGPFASPSQLRAGGGIIHPEVWETLQTSSEAEAIVQLVLPAESIEELTLKELAQHSEERKANVLPKLTPADFTLTHHLEGLPGFAGRIKFGGAVALEGHPDVLSVIPDRKLYVALEESVPLIHADGVHGEGITGADVEVVVLDTGIDANHPDLSDSILSLECFLPPAQCGPEGNPALDDNGHVTMVAGVLTSNGDNGIAGTGVAPNVGIHAWKIAGADGEADFSAVADALRRLALGHRGPVEFVNMSLTDRVAHVSGDCVYQDARDDAVIDFALEALRKHIGTVVFAASGNGTQKWGMGYPACHPLVVSVGGVYDQDLGPVSHPAPCTDATTSPDKVACGSQSSADLDLLAPGYLIRSTAPGGFAFPAGGTSLASPHAAGAAALLLEARPDLNPTSAPEGQRAAAAEALIRRMKLTGKPVFDTFTVSGVPSVRMTPRVDARVALLLDDNADFDGDGLTNGQELNGIASPKAALGTLFANPLVADTDLDGCPDGRELGANPVGGGMRDPRNPWDWFDQWTGFPNPTRDGAVVGADISAVVLRFGSTRPAFTSKDEALLESLTPPAAMTGYHVSADRGGRDPDANLWNLLPPDAAIVGTDISAVVGQFGHSGCNVVVAP